MDTDTRRPSAAVSLLNPKTPENIGGVFRALGCYGGTLLVLAGARPLRLRDLRTDTSKYHRQIPHRYVADPLEGLPGSYVPVAVDLLPGAEALPTFAHPARAYYVFGPEDGTLPPRLAAACAHHVYVPTRWSMNLAAAVNVVLYDRLAKELR